MDYSHHHGHHNRTHCYERIEAVTVCIGYHDFLQVIIERNMAHFDRWVIVTTKKDIETRELCRQYSIYCLLTDDHTRGDAPFNKGRLIERGLQHLSANGWRLHIDADILLPPNFRNIVKSSHLDEEYIYGADRIMVKSRKDFNRLLTSGWMGNDFHCRVNCPPGFQIGTRWAHHQEGYVPIGYFQMWHASEDQYHGARIKPYPHEHNDACRTDVQFGLQWDRRKRAVIPEMYVVHLESQAAKTGANWNGRQTKMF